MKSASRFVLPRKILSNLKSESHPFANRRLSARYLELWTLKFFCFFGGCWLCFFLQSHLRFSSVLAAASIGFFGTLIPKNPRLDPLHIQATIYTGTFVAMGSAIDQTSLWHLLLVSTIGTTVYFLMDRRLKGLGGKLGAIAFISTLLSLLLRGLV